MRIVLTGASGNLGAYLIDRLLNLGHDVRAWSGTAAGTRSGIPLQPIDLTDPVATSSALAGDDPEAILHAAAISAAEAVRRDPDRAFAVNVEATGRLAGWCARRDRRFLYTSTDMVFDGALGWYAEEDPARPISAYGRTKLAAEPDVLAVPRGVVARLSLLYGLSRCGRPAFFDRIVAGLRDGKSQAFFEDEYRTPLDYHTAANILIQLLENTFNGLVHVGGPERLSRFELFRRAAGPLGIDPGLVRANRRADVESIEPRPADLSLDTTLLAALLPGLCRPAIEEALAGLGRSPGGIEPSP
ncbi:MAG TPA: sugar nucleotide-binding protein [Isosphaeraceae bacterium]|nr:sugar nucleotide-binding protein [Isosphaeraceae bacterium]